MTVPASLRFFLFCFLSFTLKIYSLNFSDFYDESGQLMKIPPPPFCDYAHDFCEHHVLNSPSKVWNPYLFPCCFIYDRGKMALKRAIRASEFYLDMPPPYYWKGKKSFGYRERWMKTWENMYFTRYSDEYGGTEEGGEERSNQAIRRHFHYLEYSEFCEKLDFLHYWFNLCFNLEAIRLRKELIKKKEELKYAQECFRGTHEIKHVITCVEKHIDELEECRHSTLKCLYSDFEEVTKGFLLIYNDCIEMHAHPTAIYERGRVFFDQGDTAAFLKDVDSLLDSEHGDKLEITCCLQGKIHNDANQYNQTIKVLSDALEKNPANKELFFERAIAYFETGQFDQALSDYISSGIHPTFIDAHSENHFHYLKFSSGITLGCLKGALDSSVDFVPSLLSAIRGLGNGLWAFTSDPLGVSTELIDTCMNCVEYMKENFSIELIAELVPELRECIEKWDNLDEDKKGYYVGYVVGRYGADMLIWGGSMRAVKLSRDLKRASTTLTLEKACFSAKNLEEITIASEEFFIVRESYKARCKPHIDRQGKHIPGAHNFEPGRSELTISVNRMESLTKGRIGEGIPQRKTFGEAGYREIVDFGEEIGVHVHIDTKVRTPTSIGEIHYNKNGEYHIVPAHPNRFRD